MRTRFAAAAALALLASTAAGCAKREHAVNPANPLWLHRPGWALTLSFRRQLVADQALTSKPGIEKSVPGIDPRHGRVFVGTSDNGLYALRAGDGSVLWRFQTAGAVMSEPLYDETRDVVYFGSDDDGMYALRADDGKMLYRYRSGAEVQRRPILVEREGRGTLVFNNAADGVFAIDAETGATRWKHLRTPALGLEIAGHAGVAYANDRVYCAFSTGRVVAYDVETGNERWAEVDLSAVGNPSETEQQQYFDADATPVVIGDRVFVASVATGVFALDATAGTTVWRRAEAEGVSWLTHWSEPAHVDASSGAEVPERTLLIAGSGTTGLWALDPRTGEVRWRREGPRGTLGHPVALAGALLVTSSKLGMFLFEPQQGRPIDGIDPGSGFAGGAAAYGNKAFALTNQGVFLGLEVVPPRRDASVLKSSW